MKYTIDPANENAYKRRYGVSLQEKWENLSEEQKISAVSKRKELSDDKGSSGADFKQSDILRIVIGYKDAEFVENILKNALTVTQVVIWEPEEAVFLSACIYEDISVFINNPHIGVVFGRDNRGLLESVLSEHVFINNIYHSHIIGLGDYGSQQNEDVKCFTELFRKYAEDIVFYGNARKSAQQKPYRNLLYALSVLSNNYTVYELFDEITTREIPVILVAAGPSLMKNYKELIAAKGRALIVAVSHAAKSLYKAGIEPDMLAVTDATEHDFLGFDKEKKYLLLCSVCAGVHNQEKYNGQVVYFDFNLFEEMFPSKRIDYGFNAIADTGSVTTDVFSLFEAAGFRKFILVGQDLAYDHNGNTHTDNEFQESEYEKFNQYTETEGINGGMVKTRWDWERFRKFYESRIEINPDMEVIDATEGGALIHGSTVKPLSEAIRELCNVEYPVSEWIQSLRKGDDDEKSQIANWFEILKNCCEKALQYLDEAVSVNNEICARWKNTSGWDDIFSVMCRRYDILYNTIMDGSTTEFIRYYCIGDIQYYLENALSYEGDENIEKKMNAEKDLFEMMREKTAELSDYIQDLSKNLT